MPEKPMTFLEACWRGDLAEVTRQLDGGARINQLGRPSDDGIAYAGVHIAILEKNEALLRLLVDRGAATFTLGEDSFGMAPNAVQLAVEEGFIAGLDYLVDEKKRSLQLEKD